MPVVRSDSLPDGEDFAGQGNRKIVLFNGLRSVQMVL